MAGSSDNESNTGPPRRRVLILATTVPVTEGDGTPSFVLDLAIQLGEVFDVTVLAPRVPGSKPEAEYGNVVVRRFAYFPRRWEQLASEAIMPRLRAQPWRIFEAVSMVITMMFQGWRDCRQSRFDVVNAHWIIPAGLAAWLVRRTRGIQFLLTVHGADAYSLQGRLATAIKSRIIRAAWVVVPVSSEIGSIVGTIGGEQARVHHPVPMGVVPQEIPTTDRDLSSFLVVGRLADKKGIDVAIRAVAAVPGTKLRVIGDGPERDGLAKLARSQGVSERVEFVGRLPRGEVLAAMSECGCLLIPSRIGSGGDQEGTPVVLAEAMSVGAPVIASRIAGLGEFVADGVNGLLVSPDDVNELAQAMDRILSNPGLGRDLGQAAWQQFSGGPLDAASTAAAYRELLEEVVV